MAILPVGAWEDYEPRFGFPTFQDCRTFVSLSISPDFDPKNMKSFTDMAKTAGTLGPAAAFEFSKDFGTRIGRRDDGKVRFRIHITDRDGRYLGSKNIPGEYPPGGAVDIDVDGIIGELDQPAGDYMAIIVLSSGVMNFFGGSPGAFSVTYVGEKTYTTYRTGGFTRTLNDPRKKKHYGFRGINPKIVVDDSFMSSILLINHSSYTGYEKEITPEAKLIREDGETREAKFGLIQPFGGLERNMEELFGTDVSDFLAPYKGRGTVITRATGATLAAIHLLRKTDGTSMAIEHSRPTHAYLLNGA